MNARHPRRLAETCPVGVLPPQLFETTQYGKLIYQTYSFESLLHQIHMERRPFVDPSFPTNHPTHFHLPENCVGPNGNSRLVWESITRVFPHANFIADVPKSSDVIQGLLGNCWFIGALATIIASPEVVNLIMPQPWPTSLVGCSLFRFRFWKWGKWIEVVVDDRLPFVADGMGRMVYPPKLAFSKCQSTEYFWVSLLEKAFAKLHGSYAALDAGTASDAMIDLTGGLVDVIALQQVLNVGDSGNFQDSLWNQLKNASSERFFINCTNKCNQSHPSVTDHSLKTVGGLLMTHVYSVCQELTIQPKMNKLLRVFSKKEYRLLALRNVC